MKKIAILIIGEYDSGKTSIIKALTGFTGRNYRWQVRTLSGRETWAFVILSSLQEDQKTKYIDPNDHNIVKALEKRYRIKPNTYKLLICPLEIRVSNRLYTFEEYASALISLGFNVKMACIKKNWDGQSESDITGVQKYAKAYKIPLIVLDISDSDE